MERRPYFSFVPAPRFTRSCFKLWSGRGRAWRHLSGLQRPFAPGGPPPLLCRDVKRFALAFYPHASPAEVNAERCFLQRFSALWAAFLFADKFRHGRPVQVPRVGETKCAPEWMRCRGKSNFFRTNDLANR